MNTVCLSGRSVQDLQLKKTQNGKSYVKFRIAVDRPFAKDTQDFFTVCVWGGTAEYLSRNVTKGTVVTVSGYLTVNEYTTQNGENRRDIEVVCNECTVIFTSKTKQNGNTQKAAEEPIAPDISEEELDSEDLPFEF